MRSIIENDRAYIPNWLGFHFFNGFSVRKSLYVFFYQVAVRTLYGLRNHRRNYYGANNKNNKLFHFMFL